MTNVSSSEFDGGAHSKSTTASSTIMSVKPSVAILLSLTSKDLPAAVDFAAVEVRLKKINETCLENTKMFESILTIICLMQLKII